MVDNRLLIVTYKILRKAEAIMVKTVAYSLDLNNPLTLTLEERARTGEEIEARARSEPNNPSLRDAQLARMDHAISVQRIRAGAGLSQDSFANRFGPSIDAVLDWEQKRRPPERAALDFLSVIQREPNTVMRTLEVV
jgi:putative transcriptional regulator